MLRIFDTLDARKKEFVPVHAGKVGMYFCGMTVQSEPHVGHMRVAVVSDVFKRYLRYRGYDVTLIINFTDIDDKIIAKANEEGVTYQEIAQRNIDKFMDFVGFLGAEPADRYPRATEHITDIIETVKKLIEKGHAYESQGDVYFEVGTWPTYGKLSKKRIEDLVAGASDRVDVDDRKRNPEDFALWKAAKEGEPAWESPWGMGRPGWHIECSAMSTRYLGDHYDIHGGGTDLIFPHHENEIAQSEAATGQPYVNHWVHHGHVRLEGEKMSKSTGHYRTMAGLAEKYPPDVVRFFLLSTHYRSVIDFADERLDEAAASVERFQNLFRTLERVAGPEAEAESLGIAPEPSPAIVELKGKYIDAMDDDLNTAQAAGFLFEMVRVINQAVEAGAAPEQLRADRAVLREVTGILGLLTGVGKGDEVPAAIQQMAEDRAAARAAKDWTRADELRDAIAKAGFAVEDTPEGPIVRRT
jgi:cysteinyl-tRNA synthetase